MYLNVWLPPIMNQYKLMPYPKSISGLSEYCSVIIGIALGIAFKTLFLISASSAVVVLSSVLAAEALPSLSLNVLLLSSSPACHVSD